MYSPHGRDSNFSTLRILEESFEQFEETLEMLLESLDNILENGKQDVHANFAMLDGGRNSGLMEEG